MQRFARVGSVLWPYVVAGLLFLPAFVYPYFEDGALFAAIGNWIGDGLMPYRDVVDQKPPGIFWLTFGAERLGGTSPLVARVLDLTAVLVMAGACGRIAAAIYRPVARAAAIIGCGLLASPLIWGLPEYGQVEWFEGAAVAWGVAFILESLERTDARPALAAGALFGLGCWFKPQAVVIGGFVTMAAAGELLWRREPWRALRLSGFVAAGALATSLVFVGWLLVAGVGAEFVQQMFVANRIYLEKAPPLSAAKVLGELVSWPQLGDTLALAWLALMSLGVGSLGRRTRGAIQSRAAAVIMFAFAGAVVVQFASGRYLFLYHRVIILPVVTVLVAGGVAVVDRGIRQLGELRVSGWLRRAAAGALVVALLALVVLDQSYRNAAVSLGRWTAGAVTQRHVYGRYGRELHYFDYNAQRDLADYVRRHTEAGETVYLFGRGGVFWLNVERLPASRFVVLGQVLDDNLLRRQLLHDLSASSPALVLIRHDDAMPWFGYPPTSVRVTRIPELARWLRAGYAPVTGLGGVVVLERRDRIESPH